MVTCVRGARCYGDVVEEDLTVWVLLNETCSLSPSQLQEVQLGGSKDLLTSTIIITIIIRNPPRETHARPHLPRYETLIGFLLPKNEKTQVAGVNMMVSLQPACSLQRWQPDLARTRKAIWVLLLLRLLRR